LALAEEDSQTAELLYKIADEADKGVLIMADWMTPSRYMAVQIKRNRESPTGEWAFCVPAMPIIDRDLGSWSV
jgi:hypothetical protein